MFEIPVWDILSSYTWDSKELEFIWEVYDWYYEDLKFLDNLELKIKIIWLDDGVNVMINKLKARVKYNDIIRFIEIENIEREFKERIDPINSDDIKYINKTWLTIDIGDIVREEILIQCIN